MSKPFVFTLSLQHRYTTCHVQITFCVSFAPKCPRLRHYTLCLHKLIAKMLSAEVYNKVQGLNPK